MSDEQVKVNLGRAIRIARVYCIKAGDEDMALNIQLANKELIKALAALEKAAKALRLMMRS